MAVSKIFETKVTEVRTDERSHRGSSRGVGPKIASWDPDGDLSIRHVRDTREVGIARADAREFAEALLQMVKDAGL